VVEQAVAGEVVVVVRVSMVLMVVVSIWAGLRGCAVVFFLVVGFEADLRRSCGAASAQYPEWIVRFSIGRMDKRKNCFYFGEFREFGRNR